MWPPSLHNSPYWVIMQKVEKVASHHCLHASISYVEKVHEGLIWHPQNTTFAPRWSPIQRWRCCFERLLPKIMNLWISSHTFKRLWESCWHIFRTSFLCHVWLHLYIDPGIQHRAFRFSPNHQLSLYEALGPIGLLQNASHTHIGPSSRELPKRWKTWNDRKYSLKSLLQRNLV